MRRIAFLMVLGLMVGGALAALGLSLAPDTSRASAPVTTGGFEVPAVTPWWFDPAETSLGPSVLILTDIGVEGSEVVISYDIHDLAPPALGRVRTLEESNPFFATPRDDPVVVPELWTLETVNGDISGTSDSALVRVARFPIGEDFVLGTITGLRIDRWRMRIPYLYEIDMPVEPGSSVTLDEGFTVEVRLVLAQSTSTIVHLDYEAPSDSFTAGEAAVTRISGVGPEWLSSGQRQFEGLQLVREGPDLPDPMRLLVRSTYWVAFDQPIIVNLQGVSIG